MKSGLEGRNNQGGNPLPPRQDTRLNEVRPRRPEQLINEQGYTVNVRVSQ